MVKNRINKLNKNKLKSEVQGRGVTNFLRLIDPLKKDFLVKYKTPEKK